MKSFNKHNLIEEVMVSNRPRERLLAYGEKSLSDQELVAIILRTGSREKNVLHLAGYLLSYFETLYDFKQATIEELCAIKGIGTVKAVELKAMIELGNRISIAKQAKHGKVISSQSIGEMMISEMGDIQQERLVAVYLNTKHEIIRKETIFIGSLNQSIAHPREIFRGAVRVSAAKLILTHNHPSGDTSPSSNDISFTERMQECGEMMGIELLDHIIVGHSSYYSLKEGGLM